MEDSPHSAAADRAENGRIRNVETPFVSVIIPCYNHAHFLPEAIESVLQQSYPHREIIVVDDGSPDNTPEIAARYAGVRCLSQENKGLAGARNAGLQISAGTYIVFLDADDRLTAGALQTGVDCLNAQPELAFAFGECRRVDLEGKVIPRPDQAPKNEDLYVELLHHSFIWCPATVMYRKTILLDMGGFNTSLHVRASDDYDLYLRIARCSRIAAHGQIVAEYRLYPGSMSSNAALMLKSALYILHTQQDYIKGNPLYESACREGLKQARRYYGSKLLQNVLHDIHSGTGGRKLIADLFTLLRFYPLGPVKYMVVRIQDRIDSFRTPY